MRTDYPIDWSNHLSVIYTRSCQRSRGRSRLDAEEHMIIFVVFNLGREEIVEIEPIFETYIILMSARVQNELRVAKDTARILKGYIRIQSWEIQISGPCQNEPVHFR